MIRGLNTNIKRNGRIYHIQTEDSGVRSAIITAHLFLDGAVLAAVKTDYSDIAGLPEDNLIIEVAERMRKAHRQMINRLTSGDYDEKKKIDKALQKVESEVLSDDSSADEVKETKEPGAVAALDLMDNSASSADFQSLLLEDDDDEYEDEDEDEEETPTVYQSLKKNDNKSRIDDATEESQPVQAAASTEPLRTPEKKITGMSRSERVAALLKNFDENSEVQNFSVTERIRQLLDGDGT